MTLEQKLEIIFKEKGVLSIELFGLRLASIHVRSASGDDGEIEANLRTDDMGEIIKTIRSFRTNG